MIKLKESKVNNLIGKKPNSFIHQAIGGKVTILPDHLNEKLDGGKWNELIDIISNQQIHLWSGIWNFISYGS